MSQPSTIPPVPPAPAPRKVWPWILGAGCGVTLLLCCGVGGMGFWYFRQVASSFSTEPDKVRAAADTILQFNVPSDFAPQMTMQLPFPPMKLATFANGDNMIMLGDMQGAMYKDVKPEDLARSMQEGAKSQGGHREEIAVENPEHREFTIRGKPADFVFSEGTGETSGKKYWEVLGSVPADNGFLIFLMHVEADKYTKEQLVEIVESIH